MKNKIKSLVFSLSVICAIALMAAPAAHAAPGDIVLLQVSDTLGTVVQVPVVSSSNSVLVTSTTGQPVAVTILPAALTVPAPIITGTLVLSGSGSAPANTGTAAAWISVTSGTSSYRLPLYH